MKKISVFVVISVLVLSCGSKKRIVTVKDKRTTKTEQVVVKPKTTTTPKTSPDVHDTSNLSAVEIYILKYNAIAMDEMRISKIPASITLAQGILESGSGKGRLSIEANNHFGIKCHGWTGKKIYHDDDASQECFRKYDHAQTSFKDHSDFLTGRSRYANLFKLRPDDYKGWARGLRAAGYATDRKYPDKLISLIERYNLDKYDDIILGRTAAIAPVEVNHIVIKGDTLYSLSRKYNTTVDELKRLNRLNSNEISLGQRLIIKSK
ncbi:glucosaminidase domain-containing protein [Psychroserpens damuponensis]|uniref:glucosaminidase domain-containing protein n=1 Tax=Psychroserpens damuponensis TaxID=943936 RepID=UPI00058BEEAA|nr:glucosaminidase domain-containing protein [Psychroserpens damuponensis]